MNQDEMGRPVGGWIRFLLFHFYQAVALNGLLSGRGGPMNEERRKRYRVTAKNIAREILDEQG